MCPLCGMHLDSQELSFQCPVLNSKIKIEGKMEDLYEEEISMKVAKTVERISQYRKENLQQ